MVYTVSIFRGNFGDLSRIEISLESKQTKTNQNKNVMP